MPPVMRDDVPDTSGFPPPSLDLTLKPGWSLDASRRAFVSDDGEDVRPWKGLPPGSRVVPMVPSLASARGRVLSEPERFLARSMQVILPRSGDVEAARRAIRRWDCVEDAEASPSASLPVA